MSRIRVDELINQGNSGPTLAVEGLRVPSTKSLVVEGIISLNGDTGLTGQVLSRTTTGVGWTNVPLTDNNTTYTLSTVDGANPATDKVIRLSAGGSGSGFTDVVLVAGNNVSLTRNSGRIIIDSSFTDTNTVTRVGAAGQNYTDGDINLVGTGAATITQSGRTFTINVNDENTTYTGESGVTVTADNKIKIGQPVGPTDPVTFQQVTVSGNLIVQGTTTTSNSVTVTTLDKFINLNDVLIPTDAVADGGGIRLKGDSDHTILWSNVEDSWTSSEHFNLASGRNYMIDGDEVITSTALGNGVRQSTLESVGVLSSGRWEAQTIGIPYGGTGHTNANDALNAFLPVQAANSGKYLTTDGQDTSWAAIPPTYNGWSIGDNSVTAPVNSNDIVRVIGTGSALVTMDNVQKRLTINADNTTYNLTVENQQQPNRKSIRLTDNTGYAEEVILSAGTGVTLTRTNNRLEFSVAQDLSTSAVPTFTALNITGGVNATTYTGSGAQLEGLTGVPNGVYGSSAVIPVISVDPSGRITNISTAPNTGAAGAGGIVAGGNDYSIQYNNNGGFAGSDKIKFEPIQGELRLKGYLVSDNIVSTGATITELQALDYIKFPSKNNSERDVLNVLNGSVIYNNTDDQLQMYQDGQWLPVGGIRNIGDLLDVDLSTPAGDGQILSYSASGGRWVPTTITASGSVQQNSSLFVQNNTTPLGSGNLSFNSATNVLTYTPPDITNFITTEVDPLFTASPASGILLSHITNWTQAYNWGDHSSVGYLQATNTEKANWNEAYSWGNHASAGYLTAEVDTLDSVTGRGATTINNITVGQLTAGGLTYPNANGTIGQVLTSDGAGNVTWQNAATGSGGSGAQQLDQLTDVSLTTPTSGQVLYFNGTNWTNGASSGGSGSSTFLGLTDTPASMGSAGQVLAVNSGGTALEFISAVTGGANVTISDDPPTNPNSGDLWWESDAGRLKIRYSNVWVDANPAGGTSGSGGAYADGDVDSHLNRGTATTGQVLSWNGTDYAWVAQTDTDTTYTAGTGISLVGTQFSLDSSSSPTFAGLTLNGSALPFTDGTFDLGSSTNNWRRLYVNNLLQSVNVVIGDATAGDAITTASDNVVIGSNAGSAITTKTNNVFVGHNAGAADIGSYNVAIGPDAGDTSWGEFQNVENVAVGRLAGDVRNGNGNTALGFAALSSAAASGFSFGNIALGYYAMGNYKIDGASYNTSIGQQAGYSLSSGDANVFLGDYAGYGVTTGSNNILIGTSAGDDITTGNNNVIINGGNYQNGTTSGFAANTSNSLWIGHSSRAWITGASSGTTRTVTIPGQLTAGGLTYPISNGTSGQVLTSDGAGNVTWGAGGGGGGSATFSGLTDTPSSMGTAGQYLAVNSAGTALEYVAAPSGGGSSVYQAIGLESWTGTHAAPILFTQALNDPTGGGNQADWLQRYVSDVQAISANATATVTTIPGPTNTALSHAAFTSDSTLQNAIRSALNSNAGVNAIANAQFTIVPTDGETHTIDGTSYPVMGKLYVPTGLAASSVDVVVVFHGTVSSGTIQTASETALTQFLDVNGVNVRDKIIFSAAYPQDHISQSDQYNLTGVGTEQADFLMGDNLPYARAAVGWVKNSLNAYITAQGGSKTINDVYLFGHSQGGKLVTKMNTLETGIAGVVANAPGPIQFDQTCSADPGNTSCSKVSAIHGPSFVDTLDTVTDAGATTTNTITVGGARAATLKLNTNTVATDYGNVSGTIGDIKRINEHPHYYDGTTWRPFYLAGTSLTASTSDVNYDDVEVRMDFETVDSTTNHPINHVSGTTFAAISSSPGFVGIATSPTKFGSQSYHFSTTSNITSNFAYWTVANNSDISSTPDLLASYWEWPNRKRSGNIDWSSDWTVEFWMYATTTPTSGNYHGIFHVTSVDADEGSHGLTMWADSGGNIQFRWNNYRHTSDVVLGLNSSIAWGTIQNTWNHVALTRRASDGRIILHWNGVAQLTNKIDVNVDALNTGGCTTYFGRFRSQYQSGVNTVYDLQAGLEAYIDDLRITQFARYDADFTLPTQAYPIAPDAPPTVDPNWSNVKMRVPFDSSLDDIAAYPNSGTGYTGTGTISDNTSGLVNTTVKYGSNSLRLNNINHYVTYPEGLNGGEHLRFTGTWTIQFWINFQSMRAVDAANGARACVFSSSSNTVSTNDISVGVCTTSGPPNVFKWYYRVGGSAPSLHHQEIPYDVLVNKWNHIAITRDSNDDIKIYMNGYFLKYNVDDDDFFHDTATPITHHSSNNFRFGHPEDDVNAGEYGFDGWIDDFRWSDTVDYTDNFAPPSGPLPTTGSASSNPPGTPTGGGLTYPTTNGTNGQLLTSDGNGNVTWTLGENSDLSVNSLTSATGVTIPNGQTLKLGTGSVFVASTDVNTNFTDFLPTGGQDVRHYCNSSAAGVVLKNGGSVELYHSNTKKLETTASGIEVAGTGAFNGPVFIDNYAATAFVVTDTNTNEMFVVDSVAGKLQVGSIAGGASGIYLKHNNFGTLNAVELDGATGNILAKGSLTAGGLTYPTTNGSSGDVLTSDGAGNVTWVTGSNPGPTTVEESIVGTLTFTANGSTSYSFTGTGYPTSTAQTTNLRIHAGLKYKIINTAGTNHPLEFRSGGVVHPGYAAGWITGSKTGTQYITVPYSEVTGTNASTTFQYVCTLHPSNMNGNVEVAFF